MGSPPRRGFIRYRPDLRRRAQALRRDQTPAERKLWFEYLRDLPEKITRQKPLGTYVADFYCSGRLLVIELDGDTHYTTHGGRYDESRTAWLSAAGIRVIRFTNAEVMQEFEGVCLRIREALNV